MNAGQSAEKGGEKKRDQALAAIVQLITEGELEFGEVFSENKLLKKIKDVHNLEMSRTPLIQALAVLERDGFIEQIRTMGVRILMRNDKEVFNLLAFRTLLETKVAVELFEKLREMPEEEKDKHLAPLAVILSEAKEAQEKDKRNEFLRKGRQFHRTLAELAGMSYMGNVIESLWAKTTAAYAHKLREERLFYVARSEDMRGIVAEHRCIFEALTESPEAVKAAMRKHGEMQCVRTGLKDVGDTESAFAVG